MARPNAQQVVTFELYEPGMAWEAGLNDFLESTRAGTNRAIGPAVRAIVREMLQNALKAMYKRLFFEKNHGKTLDDFRSALSNPGALAEIVHQARVQAQCANLYLRNRRRFIRIIVSNEGVPTSAEKARIDESLAHAGKRRALRRLFETDQGPDALQEGGGIGIELVISLLEALKVPAKSFKVYVLGNRTMSRVHIPLSNSQEASNAR